ncbi:NYN domain-containing protein [Rhizophagus clarus]|uniref:NYN domain-containing protein n=1 Tax=Rhizophagus clarus TaxID=94130 RepID=A0A8H3KWJ8_9GLOM|nr:NYN domain-containing protein [Rhizophagus clarus]
MPVNTKRINNIGMLKIEIKTFQMLDTPTRFIELWKINFPLGSVNEEIINNSINFNVNIQETFGGTELSGGSKVSDEFPTQPDMTQAHVLVKLNPEVEHNIRLAFVFIDESNVYVQGSKNFAIKEKVHPDQVNVDYIRLLRLVLNGRSLGHDPVIVGSCDNPLWDELSTKGFNTSKFESEKGVDSEIVSHIADILYTEKGPGTIILLAGDGDYRPILRRALTKNWTVEICFWNKVSKLLKDIDLPEYPSLKTIIISLGPFYKKFTSAYGTANTSEKRCLKINDEHDRVKYDDVIPCYEGLNLFCFWFKYTDNSLRLYVNTFDQWDQWENIKTCMKRKYPQVQEIKKDKYCVLKI